MKPTVSARALSMVLVGVIATGCAPNNRHDPGPSAAMATVIEVIDGDTIRVELAAPFGQEETVRLLGIDTPEKPGGPRPPECGGEEATAFTTSLLARGTPVQLARDKETRDVYGRLLAWVIRSDDDTNVNLEILRNGHATTLTISPNHALASEAETAAADARRHNVGFWGRCGGEPYPLGAEN